MTNPTPSEIVALRKSSGITQTEAANLVYSKLRTWQGYEWGENDMHPAMWELFKIKVKGLKK